MPGARSRSERATLEVADNFAAVASADRLPGGRGDRAANKAHGAVAEERVHATGMETTGVFDVAERVVRHASFIGLPGLGEDQGRRPLVVEARVNRRVDAACDRTDPRGHRRVLVLSFGD